MRKSGGMLDAFSCLVWEGEPYSAEVIFSGINGDRCNARLSNPLCTAVWIHVSNVGKLRGTGNALLGAFIPIAQAIQSFYIDRFEL